MRIKCALTSREKDLIFVKKDFLVRSMRSSSASSPSIIAQLSAVGSSHSLPPVVIFSFEYLYCNLQMEDVIVNYMFDFGLGHFVFTAFTYKCQQKKRKASHLTCVSSSKNSSWYQQAALQQWILWKHQVWAINPEAHKRWLFVLVGTLLRNTAAAAATHRWFSETQKDSEMSRWKHCHCFLRVTLISVHQKCV